MRIKNDLYSEKIILKIKMIKDFYSILFLKSSQELTAIYVKSTKSCINFL